MTREGARRPAREDGQAPGGDERREEARREASSAAAPGPAGSAAASDPSAERKGWLSRSVDRLAGSPVLLNVPAILVLLIALALLLFGAYGVFAPFRDPIILALVLTVVSTPIFGWVQARVGAARRGMAAFITCAILVVAVFTPLGWVSWALLREALEGVDFLMRSYETLEDRAWFQESRERWPIVDQAWRALESMVEGLRGTGDADADADAEAGSRQGAEDGQGKAAGTGQEGAQEPGTEAAGDGPAGAGAADGAAERGGPGPPESAGSRKAPEEGQGSRGLDLAVLIGGKVGPLALPLVTAVVSNIFELTFKFGLMLLVLFFFLKDGPGILRSMRQKVPLTSDQLSRIARSFQDVSRSVIRGSFGTALVQGVVATIAFLCLGIPALFWGFIVALCALVPPLGTSLATVPLTVGLFLQGSYIKGSVLAVVAAGIGALDNFVRPVLMRTGTAIHPLWLFLSILGGLAHFGPVGIVYGPMILVLLGTILRLFLVEASRVAVPASQEAAGE